MVAAAAVAGGQFADSGSVAFLLGALGMGIAARRRQRRRDRLRQGRAVHRHAGHVAIARGLALWISDKTPISLFELEVVRWFGTGEVLGIPSAVIVFLAVAAVGWVLLNRTPYGRYVVAVGGNREAARIAGVKVNRIVFSVYVLSGICAAFAAILSVRPAGERLARLRPPLRARRDRRGRDRRHRAWPAAAPRSSARSSASSRSRWSSTC